MSLGDFLAGESARVARPGQKCTICKNPDLKKEVDEYVAGATAGTIQHSQHYIWLHYFAPTWGIKSQNTLRNHIKLCLGVDL